MSKPKKKSQPMSRLPVDQANPGAGRNGKPPPPEHRWKPGQSGNPAGRPAAGYTLREWINVLAAQDLTEDELRALARDKKTPWTKRVAAERIIHALEWGDVADMEPVLKGEMTLEELRAKGVNTEVIKRVKVRTFKKDSDQGTTEETTREIELRDRGGEGFDRLVNHTDGTPTQRINMNANHEVKVEPVVFEVLSGLPAKD